MHHQTVEILEYNYEHKINKFIKLNVNTILKQKSNFREFCAFYQHAKNHMYGI